MTVDYWIAKYVDDPFRGETRNVGVIVRSPAGTLVSRFVGEREDGTFDLRRLGQRFTHPNLYRQWRDYWRESASRADFDALTHQSNNQFFVEKGGEIADTGDDPTSDVCRFVYDLCVGEGALSAFELKEPSDEETLADEIVQAFTARMLLATGSELLVRHPIERGSQILGEHATHTPSFSQRNGCLSVIEYIDLSARRPDKVRERAGFMGYMFSDIRHHERDAQAFAVIRPATQTGEAVEYATAVLRSESIIVNWADTTERERFIEERNVVADSV